MCNETHPLAPKPGLTLLINNYYCICIAIIIGLTTLYTHTLAYSLFYNKESFRVCVCVSMCRLSMKGGRHAQIRMEGSVVL